MSCPDPSNSKPRLPLRFRWGMLVMVLILALAVTAGVTYVWQASWPGYTARGQVVVESPYPKVPMQLSEPPLPLEVLDRAVADQMARLKGETLLQKLLTDDVRVRETTWFRSGHDANERLNDLKNRLRVRQIPRTNFIEVSFSTATPADAPVIVNQLIDKYIAETMSRSRMSYADELDVYVKKQEDIRHALQKNTDAQTTFIRTFLSEPGTTQGIQVVGETWRVLAEEAARIGAERVYYRVQYENLKNLDHSGPAITPQMRALIEQDPLIARLRELKVMQELEIEASRTATTATGPADAAKQARLDAIDRKLIELSAAKEQEIREAQVEQARTLYNNAVLAEEQLLERIDTQKAKQRDLDGQIAAYEARQKEYKLLEQQLGRVTDYVDQLKMLMNTSTAIRVQGIRANVPTERSSPRWEYNLPAGFILGLLVGVPLSFTRRPRGEPKP